MTPQDKKDWIEIIVSALEINEKRKEDRLYHRTQQIRNLNEEITFKIHKDQLQGVLKNRGFDKSRRG